WEWEETMPSQRGQLPSSWTAYERGRGDSPDSTNRVSFDARTEEHHESSDGEHLHAPSAYETGTHQVRRRRSSMGMAIDAIRDAGGVNSLGNFAASWQRAVGFHEVTPVRPSFRYAEDETIEGGEEAQDTTPKQHRSLLRQQLEERDRVDQAIDEEHEETTPTRLSRVTTGERQSQTTAASEDQPLLQKITSRTPADDSIFLIEPSLASPFGGSYGSTWGSLSSRVNESSMRHAGRLFRQQQIRGGQAISDKEREPLMVKRVEEEDGKIVNVVVGQSTLPQTIFNSVNVLIGVGLLALPLAMKYAGWIPGLIFFFFAGISTCYTAKLLAKCADVDNSLITFADLAYVSFGPWARVGTSILFVLELVAACVALIVLFSDSLDALTQQSLGITEWKIICGIILIPLSFVPLRYLSFTSILGILCFIGLLMFGDGVKDEVTRNILNQQDGYPAFLSVFIVICVAIIPLTKVPLNARPIVSTLELFLGLDARAMGGAETTHGCSGLTRGIAKIAVRIICIIVFVLLAILIPEFDTIMSLLGAVACFTICLILPCAFHLKLFGKDLTYRQKVVDWSLIVVSSILALVSTGFNFVPKEKLGI
ncbi:Vacuolar amino acid transporter 1, partial [Pseudocercospora fuligena]